MNPWVLLGIALAWAASAGGAFVYGTHVGANGELATQARTEQAVRDTVAAAQQGAAAAIAAARPVNRTIVQKAEREIQTNTVYRDCRVTPDGVQLANQAITGRPSEPTGGVVVPGTGTPGR